MSSKIIYSKRPVITNLVLGLVLLFSKTILEMLDEYKKTPQEVSTNTSELQLKSSDVLDEY